MLQKIFAFSYLLPPTIYLFSYILIDYTFIVNETSYCIFSAVNYLPCLKNFDLE